MLSVRKPFLLALLVFLLAGCYNTPVRHLASDVGLLKIGESSRDDVLTYLGQPDKQIVLNDGTEKWLFKEYESSLAKSTPIVNKYFGPKDYGSVVVILKNDVVVDCIFDAYDHDEMDWADDFKWQEKK